MRARRMNTHDTGEHPLQIILGSIVAMEITHK